MRACVRARIRAWPSCACVHERALHVRLVCMRAIGVFSQACVRVDVSCACVTVMCVLSRTCVALTSRVRARRVRVVMSVRARRRLVCDVCVLSRACLRVDISCACVTVICVLSRSCVALTSRVRDSYFSQEHERFGPLVHIDKVYLSTYLNQYTHTCFYLTGTV